MDLLKGIGKICLVFLLGFVIAVMIYLIIRQVDHHYEKNTCDNRGRVTGFDTKFVDYNFWSYDCLAKRSDGKWVAFDKAINVNK